MIVRVPEIFNDLLGYFLISLSGLQGMRERGKNKGVGRVSRGEDK